jgi:hypothetical protein
MIPNGIQSSFKPPLRAGLRRAQPSRLRPGTKDGKMAQNEVLKPLFVIDVYTKIISLEKSIKNCKTTLANIILAKGVG